MRMRLITQVFSRESPDFLVSLCWEADLAIQSMVTTGGKASPSRTPGGGAVSTLMIRFQREGAQPLEETNIPEFSDWQAAYLAIQRCARI